MNNNLNVWRYGWLPWTCYSNWIQNIGNIFRNIKFSWLRVARGYCDYDTWDLDIYYCELINHTLLHLRTYTHGFPADMSEDSWSAWLEETADCFYKGNECNEVFENRYAEEAMKLFSKWTLEAIPGNKSKRLLKNYTAEEEKLDSLFLQTEKDNEIMRRLCINRGLMRLADRWSDLWD